MSEPILMPSDDAIERALASRASHRPAAGLLGAVMADVHATRQVARRGATLRDPIGDGRRPFVLLALAATLIIGGAFVLSTGSSAPAIVAPTPPAPAPTQPAAVVSPSPSPEPSATGSAQTCATQTTSVLTGDAMPPTDTQPATIANGALKAGVYMTAPFEADPVQTDVWAVTVGTAARIAAIVGPDYNQATVDDISPDGRTALIRIGVVHGAFAGPECSDLYAVRTDGSGATRLTVKGPDQWVGVGRFSSDGRYVAFPARERSAGSPVIGLVDLQGDPAEGDYLCDANVDDLHLAWSPFDDRLAAVCGANLMIIEVGGSPARSVGAAHGYEIAMGGQVFVGVGWRDPGRILLVTADTGERSNMPIHLSTLTVDRGGVRDGTWTNPVTSAPRLADAGMSTGTPVSPDGEWVALDGDPDADDPQGDTLALYVLDATRGVAQRIAPWGASDGAWSSDSRSLVYMDYVNERSVLTRYDLASKTGTALGSMPNEYRMGVWRIP